jgi:hypothetical protein
MQNYHFTIVVYAGGIFLEGGYAQSVEFFGTHAPAELSKTVRMRDCTVGDQRRNGIAMAPSACEQYEGELDAKQASVYINDSQVSNRIEACNALLK